MPADLCLPKMAGWVSPSNISIYMRIPGLDCGVGDYYLAIVITILALIVLTALRAVDRRIQRRNLPE